RDRQSLNHSSSCSPLPFVRDFRWLSVSMVSRPLLSAALSVAISAGALPAFADTAKASDRDRHFFESIEGECSGPGEIVAGKYEGTKFVCTFTGITPEEKIGMTLDGGCRVGMFTQRMTANIESGRNGYTGIFMDGAEGKGLDVVGGQVKGKKAVFA